MFLTTPRPFTSSSPGAPYYNILLGLDLRATWSPPSLSTCQKADLPDGDVSAGGGSCSPEGACVVRRCGTSVAVLPFVCLSDHGLIGGFASSKLTEAAPRSSGALPEGGVMNDSRGSPFWAMIDVDVD